MPIIKEITAIDAVRALYGRHSYDMARGDGLVKWKDGHETTEEEAAAIAAKVIELQAEYDAKQYQRDRAVAYDPIPEQLDQIYHDIDGWKAKIKSVKDKYPKPT